MIADWLNRRWAIPLIAVLMMVPLAWPAIPPLVDVPGHMGRYAIQLSDEASPLRQWYRFDWQLIGNLGVDLLMVPLAHLFGLELATRIVVMAIPAIMASGLLRLAHSLHGRIPANALFALPLAYGFSFQFGFINFNLGVGIALHLFVLWRQLEDRWPVPARAALFVPLACMLWLCHLYAWIMLGILVTANELVRTWNRDGSLTGRVVIAAAHTLPVAAPFVLMAFAANVSGSGATLDWFNFPVKLAWLAAALRERWPAYDVACLVVLVMVILRGLRSPDVTRAPVAIVAAAIMLLSYLLMPRVLLGSAYADMRLVPVMLMTALIGFADRDRTARPAMILAFAALAFLGMRLTTTTINLAHFGTQLEAEAEAITTLPHGARLVSLVTKPCRDPWALSRLDHLPAIATVRKSAFSNDQWNVPGAQLLSINYPAGKPFLNDPSQMVTDDECRRPDWRPLSQAWGMIPRDAFDYVWLINAADLRYVAPDWLEPAWQREDSALFRIVHRQEGVPAPKEQP